MKLHDGLLAVDAEILLAFGRQRPSLTAVPTPKNGNPQDCTLTNLYWERRQAKHGRPILAAAQRSAVADCRRCARDAPWLVAVLYEGDVIAFSACDQCKSIVMEKVAGA